MKCIAGSYSSRTQRACDCNGQVWSGHARGASVFGADIFLERISFLQHHHDHDFSAILILFPPYSIGYNSYHVDF